MQTELLTAHGRETARSGSQIEQQTIWGNLFQLFAAQYFCGDGIPYKIVLLQAVQINTGLIAQMSHGFRQRTICYLTGGNRDIGGQSAKLLGETLSDASIADDKTFCTVK